MEIFENYKENLKEVKSLKDFYKKLPGSVSPKSRFLDEIVKRCGVTFTTARNWVVYGMRPVDHKNVVILSELTGIPEDKLFTD